MISNLKFAKYSKFENFVRFNMGCFNLKYFSKSNSSNKELSISQIKEKLKKEPIVKIYESKYNFLSEKLLTNCAFVFSLISSSVLILFSLPIWIKITNAILLAPCILIIYESFKGATKFVKIIQLKADNKIIIYDMYSRREEIAIEDLNKALADPRVVDKDRLNHELFDIFTNKKNDRIYHAPRDAMYLNENLFHNVIEGKTLDKQ